MGFTADRFLAQRTGAALEDIQIRYGLSTTWFLNQVKMLEGLTDAGEASQVRFTMVHSGPPWTSFGRKAPNPTRGATTVARDQREIAASREAITVLVRAARLEHGYETHRNWHLVHRRRLRARWIYA